MASLTFIGLFGIYIAEGPVRAGACIDMLERQPNRLTQEPEHTQPRQGRAEGKQSLQGPTTVGGSEPTQPSLGLSLPPQEHPILQPQNTEGNPPGDNPSLRKRREVVDCVLPMSEKPPSLFQIQRNLRDGIWNIEEVPALEQQWMDYVKTMDRQALEEALRKSEARWEDWKDKHNRKRLTAHGEALLPVLEEDVKLMRTELRRRGS